MSVVVGIVIGVVGGVFSGLFGIGGGIVMVPMLVLAGLSQREASGTSLAALLMPVAILGVLEYAKRHEIRVPYAVGMALGLLGGAYFGARLAGRLTTVALQRGFGVVLLAAAVRFLFFAK